MSSNPRYKGFYQTYFTAGDEEQFFSKRIYSTPSSTPSSNAMKCQTDFTFDIWDGYINVNGQAVTDTFRYMFHKFKKGIYVHIHNNKIITFLPFSKAKYTNDWGDRIRIDPKFNNSIIEFIRYINKLGGYPFDEKKVNKYPSQWYANNCLLRYEFPLSEGDTGTQHIKSMLDELCANRTLPDMEFFINRRDFPMLKKDLTEPYDHIWDDDKKPLTSHVYEKYMPILSSVGCVGFADIPIPTIEDWARVKAIEGVSFPKTPMDRYTHVFNNEWEKKKPIAVFRGGSTGSGVTVETNPRLRIAKMSLAHSSILDAGITDWNLRPRKIKGERYLKTIEISEMPKLVKKLSPTEQSNFKYIVHIDGHVSAFRLSLELNMGSVLLIVDSKYELWFKKMLIEKVHYLSIKSDLSNLIETIEWCKKNDEKCKIIAQNAKKFYDQYLTKNAILDYLQCLLTSVKQPYSYTTLPLVIQLEHEREWFQTGLEKRTTVPVYGIPMINCRRDYNSYLALSWIIFETSLKFKKMIKKTSNTTITVCTVGGVDFVVKSSSTKRDENIHEAFIGINEINEMLRIIPNFLYTFSAIDFTNTDEKSISVIVEKIDGVSFMDWITSSLFNMTDYVSILVQLSLALHVAQKTCGFVHNDLFPWNILIEKQENPIEIEYVLEYDKVVCVVCNYIPIIIDYGKSHVVHKGVHYGFINMFKLSTIHDIVTILISSLAQVVKEKKLTTEEEKRVVGLVNFGWKSVNTFGSAKHFVCENSSFSKLVDTERFGLEEKTPKDFYMYITSLFTSSLSTSFRKYYPKYRSAVEHFSFINTCSSKHRKFIPNIPKLTDKLRVYYYFQTIDNESYLNIFNKMLEKAKYTKHEEVDNNSKFNLRDDFVFDPRVVCPKNWVDTSYACDLKQMFERVMTYSGVFEVSEKDREVFISRYSGIDVITNMKSNADCKTIEMYTKSV